MEIEVLRQQINAIVAKMDSITAVRIPTEQEIAYYPWALRLAKGRLYDIESEMLRARLTSTNGTTITWN